ncbi:peptidylprolyl isomerase [Deefgea piscis]|uniref:Peptidyl-prolyl cis-trans isomerase n=1 Tax=Deefgea piscis TaxID=2739061 RepID=A0A6M8SKZ4_9NEIS|nr:peptidylprolyl isomerase [Deefgea piscis]QKJ65832.1 peptidylprolyl isomerase [Deefgea piscis]
MKRFVIAAALALSSLTAIAANPQVELNTSKGKIIVELYPEQAPISVANFLQYVKSKHYDGTIFHRVVPGFVVQGGGYDAKQEQKPTKASIQNEAKITKEKGLKNDRGMLAMARTGQPHSATSQFYINLKNNDALNYPSFDGWGYAVFGKVLSGMEVADQMAKVNLLPGDTPAEPIILISAKELAAKTEKASASKSSTTK